MQATITQAFKFAVGGNHVIEVRAGSVVDGRCAEVALAEGWGVPFPAPAAVAVAPSAPASPIATGGSAEWVGQLPPVTPEWQDPPAVPAPVQRFGKKNKGR